METALVLPIAPSQPALLSLDIWTIMVIVTMIPRMLFLGSSGFLMLMGMALETQPEAAQLHATTGYVLDSSDCDDLDPSRYPAASWYEDADGDGFGVSDAPVDACGDITGASYASDCDDTDPLIFPGANEICDERDNNCSGSVDNEDPDLDIYTRSHVS